MHHGLRRLLIYIFAIAFIFNGAASHALTDVPTPAPHPHYDLTNRVAADHNASHHSKQVGIEIADDALSPTHEHLDSSSKCCSICAVTANVMPDFAPTIVQLLYANVVFQIYKQHLGGYLVALDPDIPKAIV